MADTWQVEIDGSEHHCCGEEIERNAVVRLRARRFGDPAALIGLQHPAERDWDMVIVEGRVTDIEALVGPDEERVAVVRLPSGDALNGFDPVDDGLLLSIVDEEPLAQKADHFVITVVGTCTRDVLPDPHSDAPPARWYRT